jgi:RNA polymerase sigma factor (sigma-70 family)
MFAGLIEPWKIRLINSRATRRGFRGSDLDEVVQRTVIALLKFRYDASRCRGATERTVVTALVDRQLKYFRRSQTRYRRHVTAASLHEEPLVDVRSMQDQSLDVRNAVNNLPPDAQQVCHLLANGLSVNEAARQLGVNWHTVEKHMRVAAEQFERLGLMPAGTHSKRDSSAA